MYVCKLSLVSTCSCSQTHLSLALVGFLALFDSLVTAPSSNGSLVVADMGFVELCDLFLHKALYRFFTALSVLQRPL